MKKVFLTVVFSLSLLLLGACSTNSASGGNSEKDKSSTHKAHLARSMSPEKLATKGLSGKALTQVKTGIRYLKTAYMGKQELHDQLISKNGAGMTSEEASAVITKLDPLVNWNNLAIYQARAYRKTVYLTGQDLVDQLTSDLGAKLTPNEAQYALKHIDDKLKGANDIWN
ncbi:MAG: Ltp family lipoprotein [Streptococcaceae bacterium]|jgi:hypothetical protein|nr:Ltp family lipoprotein [Streptococcaceae bacterium]